MTAPSSGEAHVHTEDQPELLTQSHRHCGPQKSLTSFPAHDDFSSAMSNQGEQAHHAAEVPEVKVTFLHIHILECSFVPAFPDQSQLEESLPMLHISLC